MGQSAGASSILHHLVSAGGDEELKPPFSQAILQSPAFFPEGDVSETNFNYLGFQFLSNAFSLHDLRSRDTDDLQRANRQVIYNSPYSSFKFGPTVDHDPYSLPKLPGQLLLDNKYHKGIPLILGHTSLDGLLFSPPWVRNDTALGEYVQYVYPQTPDGVLQTIKKDLYYSVPNGKDALEISKINAVFDLLDDLAISCNNNYLTKAVLKNDATTPVWRYLFSARPAIHGADVYFTVSAFLPAHLIVYMLIRSQYYPTEEAPSFVVPDMAKLMQHKFVSFILNGDPNTGSKDTDWPQYDETNILNNYRKVLKFGDLLIRPNESSVITDPLKQYRCDLWQPAPYRPSGETLLTKQGADTAWEL